MTVVVAIAIGQMILVFVACSWSYRNGRRTERARVVHIIHTIRRRGYFSPTAGWILRSVEAGGDEPAANLPQEELPPKSALPDRNPYHPPILEKT